MSKYHKTSLDGAVYYKLPQISALRIQLESIIRPTSIMIKIDGKILTEQPIKESTNKKTSSQISYHNLWINLLSSFGQKNRISVYMRFFGLYIKVMKINYILMLENDCNNFSQSDSYVSPDILTISNLNGAKLEDVIRAQPTNVRQSSRKQYNNITSIILLRLDQLGDFVLTVPAIIELKHEFPNAKITILVSPSNTKIAHRLGLFDKIISVPFTFKQKTNYRELSIEAIEHVKETVKSLVYDVAIDLSPMPETRLLLGVINAKNKFGFENTDTSMINFGMLIHAKDVINNLSNVSHALYPLILVDAVKRVIGTPNLHSVILSQEPATHLPDTLAIGSYIVVHSGARNLLVKWPLDKYVELAIHLSRAGEIIVFFADEPLDAYLKNNLRKENITVIDQHDKFEVFDEILSNAKLFIGNDSGPKHLAALRNTPVISLHSPRTNWSEWGQINNGFILSRNVPCAGCAIIEENECARDLECIKNISVAEVITVVKQSYNSINHS